MTGSNWYTDKIQQRAGAMPNPDAGRYALYIDGKKAGTFATEAEAAEYAESGRAAAEQAKTTAYLAAQREEREIAARLDDIARAEADRIADTLATPRQVAYIHRLRAQRERTGEGGGFFFYDGDPAKLTRAQASAYIDSLRGEY